ncbi:MAG: CDP-alcohol phosphatidyltransferase family protein, partial [Candidatus Omnitrophota bacterium]
ILLAIPAKAAILTAVFIFFFKAIFDWCDGPLARITNRISSTGDILDCYGAILGAMGLEIGLGFYVAHKSGWLGWYYLIPLIPLFFFGKLHSFAFYIIYRNHITPRNIEEHLARRATDNVVGSGEGSKKSVLNERLEKVRQFANNFLDHRSRTIDFICLLLLIETFTSIFVTWIIFLGFVVKEFLLFTASFYVVVKRGWVERELNNKLEELSGAFIAEKRSENQEVPAPKE